MFSIQKFLGSLTVILVLTLSTTYTAFANPPGPEPPGGFRLILSEVGTQLYQKNYAKGKPDYVQVIDLSQGASIELFHGDILVRGEEKGVYGGDNPRFQRQSLQQFWNEFSKKSPAAFCVTNGQFFYLPDTETRLAFPLKKDGKLITDGYGIKEYPDLKLMLEIWEDHVNMRFLTEEALYSSQAPDIIAGLMEEANKRAKFYVGRTFVGIDDRNLDGIFETVMIYNTLSARQVDAANILQDFGAEKVMMLDGGGSTQLICQDKDYVASERLIPQAIGVRAGPRTPTTPTPDFPRLKPIPHVAAVIAAATPTPAQLEPRDSDVAFEAELSAGTQTTQLNPLNVVWIPALIFPLAAFLFIAINRSRELN